MGRTRQHGGASSVGHRPVPGSDLPGRRRSSRGGWRPLLPGYPVLPRIFRFEAITFGHVVIGLDHSLLSLLRTHEHTHVRQYERWGLLLIPLYLLSSAAQLLRGHDPYLYNRFEKEAFAKAATPPAGVHAAGEKGNGNA